MNIIWINRFKRNINCNTKNKIAKTLKEINQSKGDNLKPEMILNIILKLFEDIFQVFVELLLKYKE